MAYYIDSLIQTNVVGGLSRWGGGPPGPTNITYGFMTSMGGGYIWNNFGMSNFQKFTDIQVNGAQRALALYAEVANINFVDNGWNDADIYFGAANFNNTNSAGFSFSPGQDTGFVNLSGDVWLNTQTLSNNNQDLGSYGFLTMLHEIGHALGLKHPGNYDAGGSSTPPPYLPTNEDNRKYSIMSYYDHPNPGSSFPQTQMLYDIAAIQYLYGANFNTRNGNNTYSWDPTKNILMTIWDGGGIDTISAANQTLSATINLYQGSFSSIGPLMDGGTQRATDNIAIAFNVTIENAIGGSGNDIINGNSVANNLQGALGRDTLHGYDGRDTLDGGAGNDSITGWSGNDFLSGGDGTDILIGDLSDSSIYSSITGNDYLSGGAGPDTLYGNYGDDTLYGGFDTDSLVGGSGNDFIHGDTGYDYLRGGIGNDYLYGDSDNDYLYGDSGNDYLNGGSGFDDLRGGLGDDIYIVDNIDDTLVEEGGIDSVIASINYSLGTNIENLKLSGTALRGHGNQLSNLIEGNSLSNQLYGFDGNDTLLGNGGSDSLHGEYGDDNLQGGIGSDSLYGGAGHDTLIGFGSGSSEYDILSGGTGTDKFMLANYNGAFYLGTDYATIVDFNWSEGDKVYIYDRLSAYTLSTGNLVGTAAIDTLIYRGDNLVGVLQDITSVSLARDFVAIAVLF